MQPRTAEPHQPEPAAEPHSSQVFIDPTGNESNHVVAIFLNEKGKSCSLITSGLTPFSLIVLAILMNLPICSWIFRGVTCELVLLHHSNQCWFQLKIICFNCRLSYCIVFLLDNRPPKVLHSIRPLISLYFFFFFWNSLQSFSLICHISGLCTDDCSQILQGSLNFSV